MLKESPSSSAANIRFVAAIRAKPKKGSGVIRMHQLDILEEKAVISLCDGLRRIQEKVE